MWAPGIGTEYTILFIHSIHFIHCILHWSHLRQKQHRTVRTLHRGHHRSSGATQTFQNSPTISSLYTLHFTSAAAMRVLGPLSLSCDACSSSLELQCCSDNTIIIKLHRSINNLQSSFSFAAARSTPIVSGPLTSLPVQAISSIDGNCCIFHRHEGYTLSTL